MTLTVLVCTLNEELNLPLVLPKLPDGIDELLIVDGRSTDRTVEVARALRPEARILTQPGRGKGDAIRHGIDHATGDFVVIFDADGSFVPEEISLFVTPLVLGFDFVKGTRFMLGGGTDDMPRHRIFGNWVFTTLANVLHGARYTDISYGFNAFRRLPILPLRLWTRGFEMEIELAIRVRQANLRATEVPCFEAARIHGEGKLHSLRDGWRILRIILLTWLHARLFGIPRYERPSG
jgi:glycosyltransferase involved in cell wall biosynthesis